MHIGKVSCRYNSKMYVNEYCDMKCGSCGWNPKVNRIRRGELRKLAREGRLREWGRDEPSKT